MNDTNDDPEIERWCHAVDVDHLERQLAYVKDLYAEAMAMLTWERTGQPFEITTYKALCLQYLAAGRVLEDALCISAQQGRRKTLAPVR